MYRNAKKCKKQKQPKELVVQLHKQQMFRRAYKIESAKLDAEFRAIVAGTDYWLRGTEGQS